MKKLLLLFILFPCLLSAQQQFSDRLALDDVDAVTHDIIKRTAWLVLERGNFRENINTFYRISSINGAYYLELKVIHGGDSFIIPRNGELKLRLESGDAITLYNSAYQATSIGAGARGWGGSGANGVTLTFPVNESNMKRLLHEYVDRIRLYTGDGYVERRITEHRGEMFMDEIALVYYSR